MLSYPTVTLCQGLLALNPQKNPSPHGTRASGGSLRLHCQQAARWTHEPTARHKDCSTTTDTNPNSSARQTHIGFSCASGNHSSCRRLNEAESPVLHFLARNVMRRLPKTRIVIGPQLQRNSRPGFRRRALCMAKVCQLCKAKLWAVQYMGF